MSLRAELAVAWRVLRAEGAASVVARSRDRVDERRRAREFAPAAAGWRPAEPVPVLNLLPMPPAPRLGGVPIQLLTRLAAEEEDRPLALLSPAAGGWRLEVTAGGERRAMRLPGPPPADDALAAPGLGEMVRRAVELLGARVLHVEGLAGLPLETLLRARAELPRLVLSLHDFAAFCPRPHLLEQPVGRFCDYCRDLARCERCLRHDWPVDGEWQALRREVAAGLLAAADALVFPSAFLLRAHQALFPALAGAPGEPAEPAAAAAPPGAASSDGPRLLVVPPASPLPQPLPPPRRRRRLPRHVAFVGSVKAHKGGEVFAAVVERLAAAGAKLRWSVYGGGDAALLGRLRRLPRVTVRGYYRAGTLPARLRRDRVDLALLLSTLPESHGLTLDETRAAGVPALAFDHGALGERLRDGGGLLVAPERGAAGVAELLGELAAGARPLPEVPDALRLGAAASDAARALAALYAELGAGPGARTP